MYLKTLFVRFYKSFNDDFLRKNNTRVKPKPWEIIDDAFYPYIEVPIESKITTIVGANESGKSHLLSAIKKAITGEGIERSDFCRYSHFFTVKRNELKYPDFGTEWSGFSNSEKANLRTIIQIPESIDFNRLLVFRQNKNILTVYLPEKGDYRPYTIPNEKKQSSTLQAIFPEILEIKSDIALPSSVPIKILVDFELEMKDIRTFELLDREQRNTIVDALDSFDSFNGDPELITKVRTWGGKNKEEIDPKASRSLKSIVKTFDDFDSFYKKRYKEYELAYKLICKIAQVDSNALLDLAKSIRNGMQGYANGILEKINRQLSTNFNFPNYWVQDRSFSLKVMARDYDLVFTITDRTGTEYSFEERSQGLRYFLSYYIQYRSHEASSPTSEILLMDEPDAYLSSQAQQDLLKVFDLFANPERDSHITYPIQVVYVTHSPFLIDKNHSERIRVLQKGYEDEGTRVVKNAVQNHYEPLRSSIGAYVGETTFIGNCNLMVEGLSDQILIAGAIAYLRNRNTPNLATLDLNQITIVPSGSASHIPYLVYLACGRDVEQPAVIVLLDSDLSGNKAKKHLLAKGGQHRRRLLKEQYILQLNDLREEFCLIENATSELEIEDIIPLSICVQATKLYLQEFLKMDEAGLLCFDESLVLDNIHNKTILNAIESSFSNLPTKEIEINKIGFARNVIRVVNEWSKQKNLREDRLHDLERFEKNFKSLFKKLNYMQRMAQQKLTKEKLSQKIERHKKNFYAVHPCTARREDVTILLDEIENMLDSSKENESAEEIEKIKNQIQNLRRVHQLDIEMNKIIDNFDQFKIDLERVKYAGLLDDPEDDIENIHDECVLEDTTDRNQGDKNKTEEKTQGDDNNTSDDTTVDPNDGQETRTRKNGNSRRKKN
ncbi:AAA family ATPase [Baaleninema simplex]|uniref:AAA family ATPase n=1 Tax=Baaleninema simplex TaxID=2862350 RepID=UPI00034C98C0|nr:AAA family ATPase [Baaleninema simplex]